MVDTYHTIARRSTVETKIRGSRFHADAVPVEDRTAAEAVLEETRKRFYDATHHCYAYRLGPGGEAYRIHDDGEPGNSAGRPILAAIDHHSLTNVIVVVTRWFGGTKLGVGGLVRAYGEAAAGALTAAGSLTCYLTTECSIRFPHAHISTVMRMCSAREVKILATGYDEHVQMRLEVRRGGLERLTADLIEATHGQLAFDPPSQG
jgi:uncharacterized YigZ family protein